VRTRDVRPRPVAQIVDDVGMSQRRFIETFRNHVGVTPKAFARLRRFQHVLGVVEHLTEVDWGRSRGGICRRQPFGVPPIPRLAKSRRRPGLTASNSYNRPAPFSLTILTRNDDERQTNRTGHPIQ